MSKLTSKPKIPALARVVGTALTAGSLLLGCADDPVAIGIPADAGAPLSDAGGDAGPADDSGPTEDADAGPAEDAGPTDDAGFIGI